MAYLLTPDEIAAHPKQESHPQLLRGRPRGSQNKLSKERREFVEMITGGIGTEERKQFAAKLREQFMDGSINPQIAVTILHWWFGKPKDVVELQAGPDLSMLSDDELVARGQQALDLIKKQQEAIDADTVSEAQHATNPAA